MRSTFPFKTQWPRLTCRRTCFTLQIQNAHAKHWANRRCFFISAKLHLVAKPFIPALHVHKQFDLRIRKSINRHFCRHFDILDEMVKEAHMSTPRNPCHVTWKNIRYYQQKQKMHLKRRSKPQRSPSPNCHTETLSAMQWPKVKFTINGPKHRTATNQHASAVHQDL